MSHDANRKVPFLYQRIEFRKADALKRRDALPRESLGRATWNGKAHAYRSILHLMRKGPRDKRRAAAGPALVGGVDGPDILNEGDE